MANLPKDSKDLVAKIQQEYGLAIQTVVRKRQDFRKQDELLNNVQDKDKIDLKTYYYIEDALLAMHYSDELKVKFNPRKFSTSQQAKNLNSLAKFDYEEMDMSIMDYAVQQNRLRRGVGLRAQVGWDATRQVPLWEVIDTRQWIPDPHGWLDPKGFRFHGFDYSVAQSALSEDEGYFDIDKLVTTESSESLLTRTYAQRSAALNPFVDDLSGDKDTGLLGIYHHYTTWKGKKLMVTLGNERTVIVRILELDPVFSEEKKDPRNVPFGVAMNHYSPQFGNPYGVSLMDLLQDKHRYRNLLANLNFLREKDLALGDDVMYDINLIPNRNDLSRATFNKKYIGVDGTRGSLANATAIMPKNPTSASSYNFDQFLSTSAAYATGVDARQLGIEGSRAITAQEAQMLQANNNLKSVFKNRINNIGEKQFWKLWLRAYHEHFGSAEKKVIRVTDSFGVTNVELKKKDFLTGEDPDIQIISRNDDAAIREKQKVDLMPILFANMQNPNLPRFQKDLSMRKAYTLAGMEEDEAIAYTGQGYEELDALQRLELLNHGDPMGAEIDNMDVDHQTYITIFQRAMETPIKYKAIFARQQAIIAMGQNKQVQDPNQSQNMASMGAAATLNASSAPQQKTVANR